MVNSRKTRAKRNIISSLFGQLIVILCGIVIPKLIIDSYGSESYGAVSAITQFLTYITLLECGIGGVARAVLYKPLAQNDKNTISVIMKEIKYFFRVIAFIFIIYVFLLACAFKAISGISVMDWVSTFLLVIAISISVFGQYFVGVSNEILLNAAQKKYVVNIVSISCIVLNTISTIFLIFQGYSLLTVKFVSGIIFLIRPFILQRYVRKHYEISNVFITEGKSYLTQKWVGLGQHVSYFLHSNTDIVVLTLCTNLKMVAVYSLYNMIVSHIQNLTISFSSGMEAVFGDMLAREEKKELNDAFNIYEGVISIISITLFSITLILIVPFVELYTQGIIDVDYKRPLFAFLMVLASLSYCLRLPYHAMVIAAGHFKHTNIAAYGESLLNLLLSIILVYKYGLVGVVLATLFAVWFRFIYYVTYLSKNIFYRKKQYFYKRFLINIFNFACNCFVGFKISELFSIDSYFQWAFYGFCLVIVLSIVTLIINFVFYKNDCQMIIGKLIK